MSETEKSNSNGSWKWMLPISAFFLLIPLYIVEFTVEILFVYLMSAIGTKWFIFGVVSWFESTKYGEKIVQILEGK